MSRSLLTAALLASTALVSPALAGEFSWIATSNNNWGTGSNWSVISGSDAAPPSRDTDIARFTDSSAYGSADFNSQSFTVNAVVLDRATTFTISNGTLAFDGTTPTIDVAAGNVLTFQNVTTTGDIVKQGDGAMAVDEHTGDIFVTDGTLQIGKAPGTSFAAGVVTGRVDLTAGTTLEVYTFGTDSVGALTGSGGTEFIDSATLTFTGSSGTFQYDGAITESGSVVGTLITHGGGTQILANAASDYSGGTTINAGTIGIFADGALGATSGGVTIDAGTLRALSSLTSSRTFTLTGSGTLDAVDGATLTIDGTVGGGGSLTKTGLGTVALTGTTGYTGSTTVGAGTLMVNTDLSSSSGVVVDAGGTLGGSGIVGTTTVNGTLAPGNSIGTINTGDITFNAGSTLEVDVDAAGGSDLIDVTGSATINGGTVSVIAGAGTYAPGAAYTILQSSGTLTGAFSGVTANFAFLDPSLSYQGNTVLLTFGAAAKDFSSVASTPNQQATANAVQSLGSGALFDAIVAMSAEEARAAFDQLSGEAQASFLTFLAGQGTDIQTAVLRRIGQGATAPGGTAVMAMVDTGASTIDLSGGGEQAIWGGFYGEHTRLAGSGNAAGAFGTGGGLIAGIDGMLGDLRAGVVVQAGVSRFSVPDRASNADSTDLGGGAFAGTKVGDTGIAVGVSLVHHVVTTTRTVAVPTAQALRGSFGADTAQVFGEITHDFALGPATLTPFGQITVVHTVRAGYTETGGPAALTMAPTTLTTTFATVGLRGSMDFAMGEQLVTVGAGIGYRRAFGAAPTATNAFAGGASFAVTGVPAALDSAVLETSIGVDISDKARIDMSYDGQLSASGQSHAITGTLSGKF